MGGIARSGRSARPRIAGTWGSIGDEYEWIAEQLNRRPRKRLTCLTPEECHEPAA
jgi:hypothetical protein